MSSAHPQEPFGPQGHDPTIRRTIPIEREQISQDELASLLDVASRDSKYGHTTFAWRDGSTSVVTERLLLADEGDKETPADRVRRFHQMEELHGVIASNTFPDDSTLWLVVGDFSDVKPSASSSSDKQSSMAQEPSLRTPNCN